METDELYDEVQETKTAFVITALVSIYCFSIIMESAAAHIEWKEICASIGFLIVATITVVLFIRIIDLKKAEKNTFKDSQ